MKTVSSSSREGREGLKRKLQGLEVFRNFLRLGKLLATREKGTRHVDQRWKIYRQKSRNYSGKGENLYVLGVVLEFSILNNISEMFLHSFTGRKAFQC